MSRETYASSPNMSIDNRTAASKYPWRSMAIGTSFRVATTEAKLRTLQNYASRMGKKLQKRFKVIDHGEAIGYEVGRLT